MHLSKQIFFDSDCLSAFLSVAKLGIPVMIYKNAIVIPKSVLKELRRSREEGFDEQLDNIIKSGVATVKDIDIGSEASKLYFQFTENPDDGFLQVGAGEAAAMALAITEHGILASNNLRDVGSYVRKYGIEHVTTGIIIHNAVENNLITADEASVIWADMINHGCKLGAMTYEEYVEKELYILK